MPRRKIQPELKDLITFNRQRLAWITRLNDPELSDCAKLNIIRGQDPYGKHRRRKSHQYKERLRIEGAVIFNLRTSPHNLSPKIGKSSKYRGVSWSQVNNCYRVVMYYDGKDTGYNKSKEERRKYLGTFPVRCNPGQPGYEKAKAKAEHAAAMAYDVKVLSLYDWHVIRSILNFKDDWTQEKAEKIFNDRLFKENAAHALETNAGVLQEKAAKAKADEMQSKIRYAMHNGKAVTQDSPPPELMDENLIPPAPRPIELIELFSRTIPKSSSDRPYYTQKELATMAKKGNWPTQYSHQEIVDSIYEECKDRYI